MIFYGRDAFFRDLTDPPERGSHPELVEGAPTFTV